MKAVLDTNIFISGIHWAGSSQKILRSWFLGRFTLVSSMPIIEEIVATLISFKITMESEDILRWESIIIEKSLLVTPKEKVSIVKRDPDDDKFIEAALEGNADYIVSMDKHLLEIEEHKGIKIITPNEFLKLIDF